MLNSVLSVLADRGDLLAKLICAIPNNRVKTRIHCFLYWHKLSVLKIQFKGIQSEISPVRHP